MALRMALFVVCLVAVAAAKLRVTLEDLDVGATEQLLHDWDLHDFFGKEVINVPSATYYVLLPWAYLTYLVLCSFAS